ncbi:ADP-ribosyltransferase [Kitasatospora sp. NPDC057541]|uniref:ADP-ribosyltransferase n=1 Tax=unclassified Kitasatospora TaxID=2633591 RepID=UPI0036BAECFB
MALTKIDSFKVDHPDKDERTVQFLWGDLTKLAPADAVDVLVVSCLPDDYTPTEGSLVGALAKAGVSVEALAKDKEKDYRPLLPCWISKPVTAAGIQFKRILVFEPKDWDADAGVPVRAIFQALACFYPTEPVRVATSLVCTGARKADPKEVPSALTWAAAHYASSNTTKVSTVKVVALTKELGDQLTPAFTEIKNNYDNVFDLKLPADYDVYVKQAKAKIGSIKLPASVTYRQAVAVSIYTTNYYKAINSVLYKKKPTDPEYRQLLPLFEAIDSGLWNLKLHTGTTYRGDNMKADRLAKHQVGAKILNTSYTSTSTDRKVAQGFATNALLDIDGRTGAEVWDYSEFPNEEEVLFPRDLTYQVDARKENPKDFWNFAVHEILTNWCGGSNHA